MKYLKEFIDPSNIHESIFIGYIWHNPNLYEKFKNHKITDETFTKSIWSFYYHTGLEMYNNSIRVFDDRTVYSFLVSRPKEGTRKSEFEKYSDFGGFDIIEELLKETYQDNQNEEYHFSEIQKYESLRKFQKEGLIDISNEILIEKFTRMNLKQLQSYFQYQTSKIFSHINSGEVVEYNLSDGLTETITKLNEGEATGLPLANAPRLNKKIKGWKKGEIIYLALSSGMGKSSFSFSTYILSLFKNNEKGLIFSNEESIFKGRSLLLATVASNVLNTPVNRGKMADGDFEENTLKKLNSAREWIEEKPSDLIKFYDMKKYRAEDVISRINMMKPLNYNYCLLDTFKTSSGSEGARWESFSEDAVSLFNAIKSEANNVGLLATVQLKIGKEYRYLDLSAIGKSMEIAEVASTVLMGRLLYGDEYPDQREAIFAYNYEKNKFTDKVEKEEYKLDPDKTYLIIFLAKSRNGSTEEQIIYEANYGINQFKEVAYCKIGKKSNTMF